MKFSIIFFISIVFFSLDGQSKPLSSITCSIRSSEPYVVKFYQPYFGYYNSNNLDTSQENEILIEKDSISTRIQVIYPSFVSLVFLKQNKEFIGRTNFLVLPGDSIHIHFDLDINNKLWATFSGSNAAGNNLFEQINFNPYTKFIPVIKKVEGLPENRHRFLELVEAEIQEAIEPFKQILDRKLITTEYYNAITTNFRMFLYNEVIKKFIHNYKEREYIEESFRDSIINTLFKRLPPFKPQLRGLYLSNLYINKYYRFKAYKNQKLSSAEGLNVKDSTIMNGNKAYLIDRELVHLLHIKNLQVREDLWAITLLEIFEFSKGYLTKSSLQQFNQLFLNSRWTRLLYKAYEITDQPNLIEYVLQMPVRILESTAITSLKDLVYMIPDKILYVDVWATWCAPCIAQFSYNKGLDSFLLKAGIERLYLSVDNVNNTKNWLNVIDTYKLGGYHIIAGKSLQAELKLLQKNDNGLIIPMYMLMKPSGDIIELSEFPPSSGTVIMQKISELIKNK